MTKTALVSLQGNTYQVDPLLVGRRVELVFDPFDLTTVAGPGPRRPGRDGDPAPDRAPRPRQGPTRDPTRAARRRPGSTTPAWSATPTTPSSPQGVNYAALAGARHRPDGELPGQLDLLTDLDVTDLDVTDLDVTDLDVTDRGVAS